jgi:L-threonylcarbamoyladenylate synthase
LKRKQVGLLVDQTGNDPLSEILERAVVSLQQGGIVAFPTETYYGLAVDPYNENALKALFRLKERELSKPILILISEVEQLEEIANSVPGSYQPLMRKFWPGPLTLIFPARKNLSPLLTGGTETVGVRISSNDIATRFCRKWGKPITATSANISGMEPAKNASEVSRMFGPQVDYIIDGGDAPAKRCSTIIGLCEHRLRLIREGQIEFPLIIQSLDH